MNKGKYIVSITLLIAVLYCCKKSQQGSSDGKLDVIKNTSLAGSKNSLQAVYTSGDARISTYYYGSFNAAGEPDSIKQVVIDRADGDTSMHMTLDDSMRVKLLYWKVAGVKQSSLLTFDYSTAGQTKVSSFYYNFTNDSSRLMSQYIVNTSTDALISKKSYAFIGGGLLQILSQVSPRGVVPDKFSSEFVVLHGTIVVLNAVIMAASTGAGCLLGGFPGCVAGGMLGLYLALKPANANADEISTAPSNAPQGPVDDLQHTRLIADELYVGTKNTSGVVAFGGGYYTVEYTDIAFEVMLNRQSNTIASAAFYATMNEIKQANSSPIPGYPTNRHSYSLGSYSFSGPTLTIHYVQDAGSFPQNNAVFVGGVNGNSVTGTLTLNRTSNGIACTVSIPINAPLTN